VFGRRSAAPSVPPKTAAPEPVRPAGTPCGTLARALAKVFREPKPEILQLGPMCGESVVYLAARGARVHVEDVEPPPPTPPRAPGEILVDKPVVRLDQPDGRFDLVIAWEVPDFVPPDRLADVGFELARVTRDGGLLFLMSLARPAEAPEPIPRYRLLADDLVVREPGPLPPRRRFNHPNRDLERALAGYSVQGIQLQRNQMREILALRVPLTG
jgi:hypothetical protein